MTKQAFLNHVIALYRVANMADSDNADRASWTKVSMAGETCCQHLDAMLRAMLADGILTGEEHQALYDTI